MPCALQHATQQVTFMQDWSTQESAVSCLVPLVTSAQHLGYSNMYRNVLLALTLIDCGNAIKGTGIAADASGCNMVRIVSYSVL